VNLDGTGAQLSDHHPRSQPGYDSGEGHLSQLGLAVGEVFFLELIRHVELLSTCLPP
jgi:hypothetical protein